MNTTVCLLLLKLPQSNIFVGNFLEKAKSRYLESKRCWIFLSHNIKKKKNYISSSISLHLLEWSVGNSQQFLEDPESLPSVVEAHGPPCFPVTHYARRCATGIGHERSHSSP